MQIKYEKGVGVGIFFTLGEITFATKVLEGIYKATGLDFVKEAMDDITRDMLPPKLELVVHNHLCQKCFRMVNDKDENSLKVIHDGDIMYQHKKCKELKSDRPN